ncbi:MAG: hypothetical protein AAF629_13600 [Chloroflexota bacterium]
MIKWLISSVFKLIFLAVVAGAGWAGYNYYFVEPTAAPSVPELAGYKVVDGQDLVGYLTELGDEASKLTETPELAGAALQVDQIIGCYQEIGAVQVRTYSDEEFPLSSGVVAIADRNALLSPVNLFKCTESSDVGAAGRGLTSIKPCQANYTVARDDNEFYITYTGTTEAICQAFCAQLEGCTAHP